MCVCVCVYGYVNVVMTSLREKLDVSLCAFLLVVASTDLDGLMDVFLGKYVHRDVGCIYVYVKRYECVHALMMTEKTHNPDLDGFVHVSWCIYTLASVYM